MKFVYPFILLVFFVLVSCNKNTEKPSADEPVKKENDSAAQLQKKQHPKVLPLKEALAQMENDSALLNASVGYLFFDDSTQEIIASKNPDLCLIPASTLKVITTATAIDVLGRNRRFRTALQYDGKIENRILHGNIYIKGGGDPALASKFFRNHYGDVVERWTQAVLKLNIDSINGQIIADAQIFDTDYTPPTWEWGEIGSDYGTAASGLSIYDNRFTIKVNLGKKGRYKINQTMTEPFLPYMEFENHIRVESVSKSSLYFLGAPYSRYKIIKGKVPKGKYNFKLEGAIPDPPYLAAYELEKKLKSNGIACRDSATTVRKLRSQGIKVNNKRKELYPVFSPGLGQLLEITNLHSNNLYAEHFLKHLGRKFYHKGDTESGSKAIISYWKNRGIQTSGLFISDGCGISRHNTLTVRQLVDVLKYMKDSSNNFTRYFNTFAVAGKTGTLRYLCRNSEAEGRIFAKSGTMNRVRAYAGYAKTLDNRLLMFALIVNNYNCKSYEMRELMEPAFIEMVKWKPIKPEL